MNIASSDEKQIWEAISIKACGWKPKKKVQSVKLIFDIASHNPFCRFAHDYFQSPPSLLNKAHKRLKNPSLTSSTP